MDKDKYVNVRLYARTVAKLRKIAAFLGKKIVVVVDEMATEKWEQVRKEALANDDGEEEVGS